MSKLYFSPWVYNKIYFDYRRTELKSKYYFALTYIEASGFTESKIKLYTCSACIDGVSIYRKSGFPSIVDAIHHIDKWLIYNGCSFLSQDQWDTYKLLL